MERRTPLIWTLCFLTFESAQGAGDDYYRAAVVDYRNIFKSPNQSMEDYALKNAENIARSMQKALTEQADIIVFPETGLFGPDYTYFVAVPDPKQNITPAGNSSWAPVLQKLSEYAKLYNMYLVVNLHENYTADGRTYKYNTNVAFNRNGTVVARYRKYHLFNEPGIEAPKKPEYVYFDTDFDVRFGMFICFDILFSQPAMGLVEWYNLTHFIHSSAWLSQLPFTTSIGVQNSFAFGNNVVVLASGLNFISHFHEGSGIHRGRSGKPLTYFNNRNGTTLVIADVPKIVGNNAAVNYSKDYIDDSDTHFIEYLPIASENIIRDYTSQPIMQDIQSVQSNKNYISTELGKIIGIHATYSLNQQLCHGDLCCDFNVSLQNQFLTGEHVVQPNVSYSLSGYSYYRLVIANGLRNFVIPGTNAGQQVCGVIACANSSVTSCATPVTGDSLSRPSVIHNELGRLYLNSTNFISVRIRGNFSNHNVLASASTMSSPDRPFEVAKLINYENIEFSSQNHSDYLNLTLHYSEHQLVSGAIYVRTFNLDQGNSKDSGASIKPSMSPESYYLMGVAVSFYIFIQSSGIND